MRSSPARSVRPLAPSTQVAHQLSRAFFDLMMRPTGWFRSASADCGLSPIQAKTLLHMDVRHPSTMSEVAQTAACEPSNLTGIVDKLEARGLVRRHAAPDDRRIKMVLLTREGAALRDRLVARFSEPAGWMLALSARDQRQLRDILRKGLAFEQAAAASAESRPG